MLSDHGRATPIALENRRLALELAVCSLGLYRNSDGSKLRRLEVYPLPWVEVYEKFLQQGVDGDSWTAMQNYQLALTQAVKRGGNSYDVVKQADEFFAYLQGK